MKRRVVALAVVSLLAGVLVGGVTDVGVASDPAVAQAGGGALARWTFDDASTVEGSPVTDMIGDFDATVTSSGSGASRSTTDGVYTGDSYWTGSLPSMRIGCDANVLEDNDDYSVFAWVKAASVVSHGFIMSWWGGGYKLSANEMPAAKIDQGTGPHVAVHSPISIDDGQWHHIGFVRTASLLTLFVDGIGVQSASLTDSQTGYPVGSCVTDPDALMHESGLYLVAPGAGISSGAISELSFFGSAMTGPEVVTEYVESQAKRSDDSGSEDGCVAGVEDPVRTSNLSFYNSWVDVSTGGRGPGLSWVRSYDSSRTGRASRLGRGWRDNFDLKVELLNGGSVAAVTEETGSVVRFVKVPGSNPVQWRPAARVRATLTSQPAVGGGSPTMLFERRKSQRFTFADPAPGAPGRLITVEDLDGNALMLQYETTGSQRLLSVVDGSGRSIGVTYDGESTTPSGVVDPFGRRTSYGYVGEELRQVIDVRGGVTAMAYSSYRLTSLTDARGKTVVANVYGSDGGVVEQRDASAALAGKKSMFVKLASANEAVAPSEVRVMEASASTAATETRRAFASTFTRGGICVGKAAGEVTGSDTTAWVVDPVVSVREDYTIDPVTLQRTGRSVGPFAGPMVQKETWAYDANGNVTTHMLGSGAEQVVTSATYNAYNLPLTTTDGKGIVTTNTYETVAPWRLVRTVLGDEPGTPEVEPAVELGEWVRADPTRPGDVTRFQDARGSLWRSTLDAATGAVTSSKDPELAQTTFGIDGFGRAVSQVAPEGTKAGGTPALWRSAMLLDEAGLAVASFDRLAEPVVDGFDRAATASGLGVSPTTQTWAMPAGAGTWKVNAGGAELATAAASGPALATQNAAADGQVVFVVNGDGTTQPADGIGGVFRASTSSNFWSVRSKASTGQWQLVKRVAGVDTIVASSAAVSGCCGGTHVVSVRFVGSAITVTVDGAPAMAVTDASLVANTKIGVTAKVAGGGRVGGIGFAKAAGGVAVTAYDAAGNAVSATDATGRRTTTVFDDANRPVKVVYPDAKELETSYDDDDLVLTQTDTADAVTSYVYDAIGRLTSTSSPAGVVASYTYNATGTVNALTQPATTGGVAVSTAFGYDSLDRSTSVDYSDSTADVLLIEYNKHSLPVRITDGATGMVCRYHDRFGNLKHSRQGAGPGVNTCTGPMISYAPDVLGNTTQITYPSGDVVSRSFDPVGRLGSVMGFTGGVNTFDYDLNGTLDSAVLANGVAVDYQSDRNGRVTSVGYSKSGATLGTFGVGRDVAGRVTSDASTLEAARTFGYDPQGRLETVSGAAAAFRFDAAGNVDRMSDNKTFTYTSANRLDKKSALGVEVQSYAFDGRGNRLSKTTTSGGAVEAYTYDAANRLKGVTGQSGYTYDGTGLRSKSVIWTAPIEFVWDRASYGLPELAQATAGTTATMYAYGPGGIPLEQKVNDGTTTSVHWFGHDQLGSTRLLTDTAGAVAATYTYAPYGQVAVKTGAASTRFQFAGEYTDPIAGFQYLRARTYDPATGQFLTRDPANSITRSAYGYVVNDPLRRTDPTGLGVECILNPGSCDLPIPDGLEAALGASQQPIADGAAGVLDTTSGGNADWITQRIGIDGNVRWNSPAMQTGRIVGYGASFLNPTGFLASTSVGGMGNGFDTSADCIQGRGGSNCGIDVTLAWASVFLPFGPGRLAARFGKGAQQGAELGTGFLVSVAGNTSDSFRLAGYYC